MKQPADYRRRLLLVALLLGGNPQTAPAQSDGKASAGRALAPSGVEIAAAARQVVLDHAVAAGATMFSRPFRFVPARLKGSLEDGAIIGVLENGAEGDETGLPPGKYHLYTARVNGQWKTYAESGGHIVRDALRTAVTQAERPARPAFRTKGWCIIVTLLGAQSGVRGAGAYVVTACF